MGATKANRSGVVFKLGDLVSFYHARKKGVISRIASGGTRVLVACDDGSDSYVAIDKLSAVAA